MKKTIYYCDICKQEVSRIRQVTVEADWALNPAAKYDVCPSCRDKVSRYLEGK
jgi:predicted SprT family Zn-dependent metalloprotease